MKKKENTILNLSEERNASTSVFHEPEKHKPEIG